MLLGFMFLPDFLTNKIMFNGEIFAKNSNL